MTTTKPGGFGRENFGDPFGAGGPLCVVRAFALDGRTVRVVFDEAPTFRTPAGLRDARNPANFRFEIAAGVATAPTAVEVSDDLARAGARGVGTGGAADERGVDVHVDRALIADVVYRVVASSVTAAIGGALGTPHSAEFPGCVPLAAAPVQRQDPIQDIANDPFGQGWFATDSGDLANQDPDAAYRKRVIRRIVTPRDAYAFLKGYGVGISLKEVAGPAQAAALRRDVESQVMQEPETASAQVVATISGSNVLDLQVTARTRRGSIVRLAVRGSPEGFVPLAA